VPFVVLLTPAARGQQGPHRETAPQSSEPRAIEAYLRAKYRNVESASVEPGPAEPSGLLFFVMGDLRPSEELPTKSRSQAASRGPESSAIAFVRDEADFLGITRPDEELRQRRSVQEDNGKVHVFFDKYIAGLRIDGADVRVHVNADGSVFAFNGYLVTMPSSVKSAVVEAAGSVHITEEIVQTTIADDLGLGVAFMMRAEKLAVPAEPYVVWKADVIFKNALGRWVYTIDAFTGGIVSKRDYLKDFESQRDKFRAHRP
jgi:Zn-dependent metalloprotease